jgi:hypothetical protein
MTYPIFGSECAPGILDADPTVALGIVPFDTIAIDFPRLFGLDRLSLDRLSSDRRLACRWHRELDGRLACFWEPDIVLIPQR